jgi:hypothetical protein
MRRLLSISAIKIANAAVSLLALLLIGRYGNESLTIYVGTIAVVTICTSLWDCGAATLNSNVKLIDNIAYKVNINKWIYYMLKLIAVVLMIAAIYNQNTGQKSINILAGLIGVASSTFILRWGMIKRRSGNIRESILISESIPNLFRLLLVPLFITHAGVGFLCYYAGSLLYSHWICRKKKIQFLNVYFIEADELNTINDKFSVFYSIIASLKNQMLSAMSPHLAAGNGVAIALQQRIIGILQILLSGMHMIMPIQIKSQNTRKINFQISFVAALWLMLSLFGTQIIEVAFIMFGQPPNLGYSVDTIIWLILWLPVVTTPIAIWQISLGRSGRTITLELAIIALYVVAIGKI